MRTALILLLLSFHALAGDYVFHSRWEIDYKNARGDSFTSDPDRWKEPRIGDTQCVIAYEVEERENVFKREVLCVDPDADGGVARKELRCEGGAKKTTVCKMLFKDIHLQVEITRYPTWAHHRKTSLQRELGEKTY
jgi:hypothetical protein